MSLEVLKNRKKFETNLEQSVALKKIHKKSLKCLGKCKRASKRLSNHFTDLNDL